MFNEKTQKPARGEALRGRSDPMPVTEMHYVNGHPLTPPYPSGMKGTGCF